MRAFATILAFAASAMAYSVTAPTNATGFVNDGQNTVSWTKVSTDPANFTILLVNNNIFPNYQQILDALVPGSDGTIQVNPPSTGWPTSGAGYQINFVQDVDHLSSILAQSQDFSFHDPTTNTTNTTSSTLPTTALTVPALTLTAPSSAITSSGASGSGDQGTNTANASDTAPPPTTTNAAAPAMGMQAAFFGAVALVGAMLA